MSHYIVTITNAGMLDQLKKVIEEVTEPNFVEVMRTVTGEENPPTVFDVLTSQEIESEKTVNYIATAKSNKVLKPDAWRKLFEVYKAAKGVVNPPVLTEVPSIPKSSSGERAAREPKVKIEKPVTASNNRWRPGCKTYPVHEVFYEMLVNNTPLSIDQIVNRSNELKLSTKVIDEGHVRGIIKGYAPDSNWETGGLQCVKDGNGVVTVSKRV